MSNPFHAKLMPGMFVYKDRSGKEQGLLFQFNPESVKRSRTVSLQENDTSDPQGTTTGRGEAGRKYSLKAERWRVSFDLRLDASRTFPKHLGLLKPRNAAGDLSSSLTPLEGVLAGIKQLEALVEPTELARVQDPKTPTGFTEHAEPPLVQFHFGERTWHGFITSLSLNETMFTNDLQPMMVEASISMEIIQSMATACRGLTGGVS